MNLKEHTDLSHLCIHTITTKPWQIEEAAKNYSAAGVKGITVWRDALEGRNISQTGKIHSDVRKRWEAGDEKVKINY